MISRWDLFTVLAAYILRLTIVSKTNRPVEVLHLINWASEEMDYQSHTVCVKVTWVHRVGVSCIVPGLGINFAAWDGTRIRRLLKAYCWKNVAHLIQTCFTTYKAHSRSCSAGALALNRLHVSSA